MNLILIGAPGSGKGTQAKIIEKHFNIPHVSTGDILRQNIKNNTPLGEIVKDVMAKGEMVSDDLMNQLVKNRLSEADCKKGYVLDGYPRSIEQANYLAKITKVTSVIFLDVMEHIIEKRLTSRRICLDCGNIISTENYFLEKCDKCGGQLIQREDDKLETVRRRLEVYADQTAPLIKYYQDKKILVRIFGSDTPEDTFNDILSTLKKTGGKR